MDFFKELCLSMVTQEVKNCLAFSLRGCYLILNLLLLVFSFCGFVGFFHFFFFNLVVNVILISAIKLNEFCSSLLARVALFNK